MSNNSKLSIILLLIFISSFYTWIMGFSTVYYSIWVGLLTALSLDIIVNQTKNEVEKIQNKKEKELNQNENL